MSHFINRARRQLAFFKLFLIIVAFVGFSGQAAALTAYEKFLEKATGGDLASMNLLGNMLKTGTGGAQKDVQASKKWFEKAANKGYAPSAFNLGLMYEIGTDGIEKDLSLAKKYYQQSSASGYQRATLRLNELERYSLQANSELEKGVWSDPKTGLTWMRCLMGQRWTGTSCQGTPMIANWWESLLVLKSLNLPDSNDWRLPSLQELAGIRTCSLNHYLTTAITASGEFTYNPWCAERTTPINVGIFVGLAQSKTNEYVWSSTIGSAKLKGYIYSLCYSQSCLSGGGGLIDVGGKIADSGFPRYILAVRGGQPDGDYVSSLQEANKNAADIAEKKAREDAEAERIRLAQEIEDRSFSALLNNQNPQTMYLAAGSFERNGNSYKAKQVYESIISRFPSSNWAVKANDQLNDTKRSNDAESAASQRQYDTQRANQEADSSSKLQCSVRISHCEKTCSGMKGDIWRRCNSGCQSICSQF